MSGCQGSVLLLRMYHEAFWVAVAAAAPVIALAAIVAFSDAAGQLSGFLEWAAEHPLREPSKRAWRRSAGDTKEFQRSVILSAFSQWATLDCRLRCSVWRWVAWRAAGM